MKICENCNFRFAQNTVKDTFYNTKFAYLVFENVINQKYPVAKYCYFFHFYNFKMEHPVVLCVCQPKTLVSLQNSIPENFIMESFLPERPIRSVHCGLWTIDFYREDIFS